MLDTVKIQLEESDFEVFQTHYFKPDIDRLKNSLGFSKAVNNPSLSDYKLGIYLPRLTYIKRGRSVYLTIEFSAPKLIYKENVNEVEESQYEEIIDVLQSKIRHMGVNVTSGALKKAKVLAFHPSKNIKLQGGYTASYVISEFSKVNIDKRLDLTRYRFTEGKGSSLQFYTKQHSFVIYDKIADLVASKSRAIDKDFVGSQRTIFNEIKEKKEYFEIIRFEVRICARSKLTNILEQVGYVGDLDFQSLFKKDICKRVLYYYWTKYFMMANLFLFDIEESPQKLLANIKAVCPDMRLRSLAYLLGIKLLCTDKGGIMGLRGIISENEWQGVRKGINVLNDSIKGSFVFVEQINQELLGFSKFTYILTE
jgi:hypothetical protein